MRHNTHPLISLKFRTSRNGIVTNLAGQAELCTMGLGLECFGGGRQPLASNISDVLEKRIFVGRSAAGIATLMVATYHLTWRLPETSSIMPIAWVGVEIFFLMSEFVIANSEKNVSTLDFAGGGRFL